MPLFPAAPMKSPSFDQIAMFLTKDISLRRGPRVDDAVKEAVTGGDGKHMTERLAKSAADFMAAAIRCPLHRLIMAPLLATLLQMAVLVGVHSAGKQKNKFARIDRLFCIFNTLCYAMLAMQVGLALGKTGWF